jgi:hypothetical protein
MSEEIKILSAFFLGLLSSSFGAWLAHFFSERRLRKDDYNKSAVEFRNAFLPEIIYLKHNAIVDEKSSSDLCEYLRSYYLMQLKSLEIFKTHLSDTKKQAIEKAWQEFCYHPESPNTLWFEQYSWKITGKGKDREPNFKKLALERIEKIVGYASLK